MSTIHSSWVPVGVSDWEIDGQGEAEHRRVDGDEQDGQQQDGERGPLLDARTRRSYMG